LNGAGPSEQHGCGSEKASPVYLERREMSVTSHDTKSIVADLVEMLGGNYYEVVRRTGSYD
jgi:hypothetical protein